MVNGPTIPRKGGSNNGNNDEPDDKRLYTANGFLASDVDNGNPSDPGGSDDSESEPSSPSDTDSSRDSDDDDRDDSDLSESDSVAGSPPRKRRKRKKRHKRRSTRKRVKKQYVDAFGKRLTKMLHYGTNTHQHEPLILEMNKLSSLTKVLKLADGMLLPHWMQQSVIEQPIHGRVVVWNREVRRLRKRLAASPTENALAAEAIRLAASAVETVSRMAVLTQTAMLLERLPKAQQRNCQSTLRWTILQEGFSAFSAVADAYITKVTNTANYHGYAIYNGYKRRVQSRPRRELNAAGAPAASTTNKSSTFRGTCNNCGVKGHYKRNCRKPGGGAHTG